MHDRARGPSAGQCARLAHRLLGDFAQRASFVSSLRPEQLERAAHVEAGAGGDDALGLLDEGARVEGVLQLAGEFGAGAEAVAGDDPEVAAPARISQNGSSVSARLCP